MFNMKDKFNVITVVSPSVYGGEMKDQDRAVFHYPTATACVCDGVTNSPESQKASTIITQFAPTIFNGTSANLKTLSDLLTANRKTAIETGVTITPSIPDSMKKFLEESAQKKLKHSFQTTIVCARLFPKTNRINLKLVSCGDSGFFAFSSSGEVMMTNLSEKNFISESNNNSDKQKIYFGPGMEVLARFEGTLSQHTKLAKHMKISNTGNWLVCKPICLCGNTNISNSVQNVNISLEPDELLLVPKYLVPTPKDVNFLEFRRFYFSQIIRRIQPKCLSNSDLTFDMQGNTTEVLPDHYYTGRYKQFDDCFPPDTYFLLCSDGFYRCFSQPGQMWKWQKKHQIQLTSKHQQKLLLDELHQQLNQKCGDDDISFIWIIPKT